MHHKGQSLVLLYLTYLSMIHFFSIKKSEVCNFVDDNILFCGCKNLDLVFSILMVYLSSKSATDVGPNGIKISWKLELTLEGELVIVTDERITQQKKFVAKIYSVLRAKFGKYVIEKDINNLSLAIGI